MNMIHNMYHRCELQDIFSQTGQHWTRILFSSGAKKSGKMHMDRSEQFESRPAAAQYESVPSPTVKAQRRNAPSAADGVGSRKPPAAGPNRTTLSQRECNRTTLWAALFSSWHAIKSSLSRAHSSQTS